LLIRIQGTLSLEFVIATSFAVYLYETFVDDIKYRY
jgi:hypothetical protein